MAHYLYRRMAEAANPEDDYEMVEGESWLKAVVGLDLNNGTFEVWTLRSGEPRVYQISTESVRTVRRVE